MARTQVTIDPTTDEPPTEQLSDREESLVRLILSQEFLCDAIEAGSIVQLRAAADSRQNGLFPEAATVEVNSGDAAAALQTVQKLKDGLSLLLVHNALQFLIETRQFLGACFAKLAIGGLMVVTTPHQFLYERKLRLPSRRNPLHRRFYTPNTLLADIEEAIDPCECRVRFLADNDAGYDYRAALGGEPDGAQDIVVALEKIARPPWRPELDRDELWATTSNQPTRFLEIDKGNPTLIRSVVPDRRGVDRILVMKLDHRGDFLMANGAFKILRKAFPAAEITLVCGSWNVGEAKKLRLFDKVTALDFFPEDDSARQQTPPRDVLIQEFLKEMGAATFDLAVDLRLIDDTREVLRAVKARNYAGFDRYDFFPWLTIRLNAPGATEDDRAERRLITANHFSSSVCKHLGYEIRADAPYLCEHWQSMIWGPYHALNPGHYQFECLIEPLGDDFEIPFDVMTESGKKTLHAGMLSVSRERRPALLLNVDTRLESFEFRVIGNPGFEVKPFRFFGLRYVRPGVIRGVHQSEAMALLAHLIQLRLENAYATEVL
jgi:hypothetical protein